MTTWVNNRHLEDWAGVDGIYLTYSATVTRIGNKVKVSGQTVSWHKQGYGSASGYTYALYLDKYVNGWQRVQTVFSGTMTFGYYDYPTYNWYPADFEFDVNSGTNSQTFRFINSDGDGVIEFSIKFPSGGNFSSITPGTDRFTVTGGISSFGDPNTGYVELIILESAYNAGGIPQYYVRLGDNVRSDTATLDHTKTPANNPQFMVLPNRRYYLGIYAVSSNSDYRYDGGAVYTLAPAPTVEFVKVSNKNALFNYSLVADGGALDKTLEYSLDEGVTWVTVATFSGTSARTGTFTISDLAYGDYVLKTRIRTTAGTNNAPDIEFSTGSINGVGPGGVRITGALGSVGGVATRINKIISYKETI